MLYMVIETFRNGDAGPVYRRFRERGRLTPDGLQYVSSWVDAEYTRCFQLMACDHVALLEQWADQWRDLIDFEIVPVVTSAEASAARSPRDE